MRLFAVIFPVMLNSGKAQQKTGFPQKPGSVYICLNQPLTASFNALPALNTGFLEAGISIS